MCLQYKTFESTAEKREIASNKDFVLFPLCFPNLLKNFAIFIKSKIVVRKLSIWKSKICRLGKTINYRELKWQTLSLTKKK